MNIGDLTLDQYGDLLDFLREMSSATVSHAVLFYADTDHECGEVDYERLRYEAGDIDPEDVLRYFAWESSVKEMMSQTRWLLAEQGYPVEEYIPDATS